MRIGALHRINKQSDGIVVLNRPGVVFDCRELVSRKILSFSVNSIVEVHLVAPDARHQNVASKSPL
jgi:hypothetical protein